MGKDQISILIIESDTEVLQAMTCILESSPIASKLEIAEDTDEALIKIIELNPDLVFLEYPVKGKTGTGIIKFIHAKLPQSTIAFISGSKNYAAEAIHLDVYNYLLRPLKKTEVGKLLEKVRLKKNTHSLSRINEIIKKNHLDTRLAFNTLKGSIITNPDEILYCKSEASFTELHFSNKTMEVALLNLSQIEEILNPYHFKRISRSTIINKDYIRRINLKTNTVVLSSNGEESEITGSRVTIREIGKQI